MIITLTGANSLTLGRELRKHTSEFIKEHGDLALERVDGEEVGFEHVREALTALPFLSSKKMVVLRAPGTNKQFQEKFEDLLAQVPETTDVIIVEPKLDKRLGYYKQLKQQTDFREYGELDVAGLASWLSGEAKREGVKLSVHDARYLVERVGTDQRLLENELQKLLLAGQDITRQTIDRLTDPAPQSTIFELLDAAFSGRTKRALELYSEQRALKVEPQQIIAMLAWQLHIVSIIKAAGDRSPDVIAKQARLSPFVVRRSQGIARRVELPELKQLLLKLLDIDRKSKRTALDLDEALQNYLLKLG
jgi:DNA polymerase-3 subunit delta